ncbi:MAG: ribbon-helix-helix protein, CopG family [Cyanobacteria bacterium CRU_2_1]|nr:ribbon-helix-helix protein, CopG family [Cyanobacteria bacterium RU_5_0]NJR63929.1 ribbon-helix-helix protein, CopG family [Cyanobacteria bacterium CRU_2_1]
MAMATNDGMATKKPQVTVYVTDEVNAALDKAAGDERRSRSQMAALLIEEALKARGYELTSESEAKEEPS